jgi:hypothetical protein
MRWLGWRFSRSGNSLLFLIRYKTEAVIAIQKDSRDGATAISLWDNKANAEAYNANAYPEVLKTMARFIEGTPKVQTGEVVNSTFHKIAVEVGA